MWEASPVYRKWKPLTARLMDVRLTELVRVRAEANQLDFQEENGRFEAPRAWAGGHGILTNTCLGYQSVSAAIVFSAQITLELGIGLNIPESGFGYRRA
jgi:hypothetical protein